MLLQTFFVEQIVNFHDFLLENGLPLEDQLEKHVKAPQELRKDALNQQFQIV